MSGPSSNIFICPDQDCTHSAGPVTYYLLHFLPTHFLGASYASAVYYNQGYTIDLPNSIGPCARSWSKVNEESIHERLIDFYFVAGRTFDRLVVT